MGVYSDRLVPSVAATLAALNARHAFVVHGFDAATGSGIDELSISGPTFVAEVRSSPGQSGEVAFSKVTPETFGLALAPIESLAGGDAPTNAAILRAIFAGEPGPRRDVVVMNAAAVLVTAGLAPDFAGGARLAQATIDSGSVSRLVAQLTQHNR
jgi:anthranilate phosphoribosyltransferase